MFSLYIEKYKNNSFFHAENAKQLIHEPYKPEIIGPYFII